MAEASQGCPKCTSRSFTPGETCPICGYSGIRAAYEEAERARPPRTCWADAVGGDPGLRRLEAVWAERERALDGGGEDQGMAVEGKVYTCRQ